MTFARYRHRVAALFIPGFVISLTKLFSVVTVATLILSGAHETFAQDVFFVTSTVNDPWWWFGSEHMWRIILSVMGLTMFMTLSSLFTAYCQDTEKDFNHIMTLIEKYNATEQKMEMREQAILLLEIYIGN